MGAQGASGECLELKVKPQIFGLINPSGLSSPSIAFSPFFVQFCLPLDLLSTYPHLSWFRASWSVLHRRPNRCRHWAYTLVRTWNLSKHQLWSKKGFGKTGKSVRPRLCLQIRIIRVSWLLLVVVLREGHSQRGGGWVVFTCLLIWSSEHLASSRTTCVVEPVLWLAACVNFLRLSFLLHCNPHQASSLHLFKLPSYLSYPAKFIICPWQRTTCS